MSSAKPYSFQKRQLAMAWRCNISKPFFIFAPCPFLYSFPLAFISDTMTEDQVFCLLMFGKLCFLLGARSKRVALTPVSPESLCFA